MAARAHLAVLRLGRVSWQQAESLQRALVAAKVEAALAVRNSASGVSASAAPLQPHDALLLCEHPPVYTAGRRIQVILHPSTSSFVLLNLSGCSPTFTSRNGLNLLARNTCIATVAERQRFMDQASSLGSYHCFDMPCTELTRVFTRRVRSHRYPIVSLRGRGGTRWFVNVLEETMIRCCSDFGVVAGRSEHTGVWVGSNKIGAIGIQVSRGVTWHGFALNCETDLSWFDHIGTVPTLCKKGRTCFLTSGTLQYHAGLLKAGSLHFLWKLAVLSQLQTLKKPLSTTSGRASKRCEPSNRVQAKQQRFL